MQKLASTNYRSFGSFCIIARRKKVSLIAIYNIDSVSIDDYRGYIQKETCLQDPLTLSKTCIFSLHQNHIFSPLTASWDSPDNAQGFKKLVMSTNCSATLGGYSNKKAFNALGNFCVIGSR